ncbi:lipase/acyltransferase domain-containing protein [Streptomyces boninensis]|uniref:lipase/acyltransferase domain-containing protein n=1 Tax=Streptomyces boninensis TaxID=2039455 RepID=UPI003B225F0D
MLARDGREVWNATLAVAGRHALGRLKDLDGLALPPGIGDEDPRDGVEAVAVLRGLHVLPGVSAVDGYAALFTFLRRRLDFSAGNLCEFAYDWRVSVRLNAARMGRRVEAMLEEWRRRSGNPEAEVVFIAHSMGGLIARYYVDVLGGSAITRRLITIGTPYRGSINALSTLQSGVAPRLGPLSRPFTRLARSLPSLHQLLPTWPCVVAPDGSRTALAPADLLAADAGHLASAQRLHQELEQAAPRNARYELHIFGGSRQPTAQSAVRDKADESFRISRALDGEDHRGDGTVPRFSCFPPDFTDDTGVRYFAQKHGALQNERALLNQIEAILTARSPRSFLDGRLELGIDTPEVVEAGVCPVTLDADADDLALSATAQDAESGETTRAYALRNRGAGRYDARLELPAPGAWRITVGDAAPTGGRVHPVTSIVLAAP